MSEKKKGQVRVGKIKYEGKNKIKPSYEGFTAIEVMTASTEYGNLSPYQLKKDNRIMENIWQFSKLYKKVHRSVQRYSRYDNTIIWDYPEETHVDEKSNILSSYWKWRSQGFNAKHAIRYPVGYNHKHEVICSIKVNEETKDLEVLNYIEARKQIYLPLYNSLVKEQEDFKNLKKRLNNGENLLIIEVDGPVQNSLEYYKKKYNVKDDFIDKDTILINEENIHIMLNDERHCFGHGYCMAIELLDMDVSKM